MRSVKRTARTLMMVILVCLMLNTMVFAAGTGSVWLNVAQNSTGDGTTVSIAADTAILDGQVGLTYDAAALTYDSTQANDTCVAMYSVNADTAGVVKIAWVAAGPYTLENAEWIFQVKFTGASGDVTLDGTMNTGDGTPAEQAPNLDTTGLKAAVDTAKSLYKNNYTSGSFRAVETALKEAEAVLADPAATQAEVDAAEKALNDAMEHLVCKRFKDTSALIKAISRASRLDGSEYTGESFANVETALEEARCVLADPKSTQQDIDEAAKALNDAMDALVLKEDEQPTEPAPTEPGTDKPGQGSGSLLDKIRDWIGGIFRPVKPQPTEPTEPETEPTIPETQPTEPETEPTEPTEPEEDTTPIWGRWFGWIGKWFRWNR